MIAAGLQIAISRSFSSFDVSDRKISNSVEDGSRDDHKQASFSDDFGGDQGASGALSALESLPADVVVPPRLVVSRKVGQRILKLMAEPGEPTAAIEKLFEDGGER